MANLTNLSLHTNHLTSLPPEIGQLANLATLDLTDNELTALPPEIGRLPKLTDLLDFEDQETTLGVDVRPWTFPHPDDPRDEAKRITLNVWDFEGQEINHQSHQFFLTRRSLYLLVFKGREQLRVDRMEYWLDTIRARAPGARVVLVATHCEDRTPHVPVHRL